MRSNWIGGNLSFSLSLCSKSGLQPKRLILDPSSKLPLYKHTGAKAPSPAKQSQGSGNQAKSQDSSAASGGQYCIYQKPKQVTCNVAHMKRVTNKYKYYCGTHSQGKVCTSYRLGQLKCVYLTTSTIRKFSEYFFIHSPPSINTQMLTLRSDFLSMCFSRNK